MNRDYIDPGEVKEIVTDISEEALTDAIVRNIWDEAFYSMTLINQCYRGEGETSPVA